MKSMTGYGRGSAANGGARYTVEIQSVNRKQTDVSVSLPRDLSSLEMQVRETVHRAVSRGRLNVAVDASFSGGNAEPKVDRDLARKVRDALVDLRSDLKLKGEIDLEMIARVPGVLALSDKRLLPEDAWPKVLEALDAALADLSVMRLREGKHLAKDLIGRLKNVRQTIRRIRALHPAVTKRFGEALRERLHKSGFATEAQDERLLRELAYFADRSDISEELTRLESHLAQFAHQLRSSEPVGRPLDFLTQEIARELNTLGAKANDAEISQCVVACKSEMEKIREQVQNIE